MNNQNGNRQDTHLGTTWLELVRIARSYGFRIGYHQTFIGTDSSGRSVEEQEIILFLEEKGLILYAASLNGTSVSIATLYGELKHNGILSDQQWDALTECSGFSGTGDNTLAFDTDVREGLLFQLDTLSKVFDFSKYWTKINYLYFANYMDTKDGNRSISEINTKKLRACKPEVRRILFG